MALSSSGVVAGAHMTKIDNDFARLALFIFDRNTIAVAFDELIKQWQRIVIVDETHDLAGAQRIEGAENGGMSEALGNPARVEGINLIGRKM